MLGSRISSCFLIYLSPVNVSLSHYSCFAYRSYWSLRLCLVLLPAFIHVAAKGKNMRSFCNTKISMSTQRSCAKLLNFYTTELLGVVTPTSLQEGSQAREFLICHTSRSNRASSSCSLKDHAMKIAGTNAFCLTPHRCPGLGELLPSVQ